MTNYKRYQQSDSIMIDIKGFRTAPNGMEIAAYIGVKVNDVYLGFVILSNDYPQERNWKAVFNSVSHNKNLQSKYRYKTEHDAIEALIDISKWEWRYF